MSATRTTRIEAGRKRRDRYFAHDPGTPLDPKQRIEFAGLVYFAERPDLAFEATIDESGLDVGEAIELQTVNGHATPVVRAGRIRFEVNGIPVTLSAFKDVDRARNFLPLRDGGAGSETYAGGRDVDPRAHPDETLLVDFNYAYTPYCTYSDG